MCGPTWAQTTELRLNKNFYNTCECVGVNQCASLLLILLGHVSKCICTSFLILDTAQLSIFKHHLSASVRRPPASPGPVNTTPYFKQAESRRGLRHFTQKQSHLRLEKMKPDEWNSEDTRACWRRVRGWLTADLQQLLWTPLICWTSLHPAGCREEVQHQLWEEMLYV